LETEGVKIFWSWLSDHDGKVSHYFVRDALDEAIKTLKAASSLEEPSEADRRAQLHLDHDTKGVTGWVDITQSIFKKIEDSAVFIADVTPVAFSPSKKDKAGKEVGMRPIMNPNVAIELGYALKALDWSQIIPVMNTAYGSVDWADSVGCTTITTARCLRLGWGLMSRADAVCAREFDAALALSPLLQ
jgi:hypothetical protein